MGFLYGFNEKRNEYVHPAAIILLSPTGRVSRYLYGIEYDPKTLRLSLVEAGQGKIGTTIDQLVLYCFHYDDKEGSYAPVAMNIMRVSSGARRHVARRCSHVILAHGVPSEEEALRFRSEGSRSSSS